MGLRAKLFVTIGTLLVIYILLILFIPTYIVAKDVHAGSEELYELIVKNNQRVARAEELLVAQLFETMRESLSSFMIAANFIDNIKTLFGPNQQQSLWSLLVDIANFNPQFGLMQINAIEKQINVLFTPSETALYQAKITQISDEEAEISIGDQGSFLGLKLLFDKSSLFTGDYYAVLHWDELSQVAELEAEINEFKKKYGSGEKINLGLAYLSNAPPALSPQIWTRKNLLIQVLVPLLFDKKIYYKEKEWTPAGLVHVLADGSTEAIITDELLKFTSIVDAKQFYENNAPPAGAPRVATKDFFLANPKLNFMYLGNTLKTDYTYFSMGMAIDPLALELARWANKTVILRVGDEVRAYGRFGSVTLETQTQQELFQKPSGTIVINNVNYFFVNLAKLEKGRIAFYLLTPLEDHESIAKASLEMSRETAKKISLQLFLISIVIALLIFFAISRLALIAIIRPLVKLASATSVVTKGDYSNVILPPIGKRKDEVAALIADFEQMVKGLKEKEKIRGVLNKVVSPEIAEEILRSQIRLGGEERQMSVLFGDIRNFTKMTEHLSPTETIALLNECMTILTEKVDANGGIVDKYVGDEIMVLYGVPVAKTGHALAAVTTASQMLQALKTWNEAREASQKPRVDVGIGIHTGVAVAGNMGASNRLNYTAVGTTVNIAARLCEAAKPGQILVSQDTAKLIAASFKLKPLEPIQLKGISEPFPVFEVVY